jgi:hypothetical protein
VARFETTGWSVLAASCYPDMPPLAPWGQIVDAASAHASVSPDTEEILRAEQQLSAAQRGSAVARDVARRQTSWQFVCLCPALAQHGNLRFVRQLIGKAGTVPTGPFWTVVRGRMSVRVTLSGLRVYRCQRQAVLSWMMASWMLVTACNGSHSCRG